MEAEPVEMQPEDAQAASAGLTMSQRMLDAAICAYDFSPSGTFGPNPTYWHPIGITKVLASFADGASHINAGFVAETHDGWIVLGIRGTLPPSDASWTKFIASLRDWWQDSETALVDFDYQGVSAGKVEKGFQEATDSIWADVTTALDGVDWSSVKGLQIAGHSKGAAMTFLAAARARIHYPHIASIEVHAYAAPLAGDPAFAAWYGANNLDATTTRYQRIDDLVPFLPPSSAWLDGLPNSWLGWAIYGFGIWLSHGYAEVGSIEFYGGPATAPLPPLQGAAGAAAAQQAIQAAINGDEAGKLVHAHSAVCSYWPGLFQTASTDPKCAQTIIIPVPGS